MLLGWDYGALYREYRDRNVFRLCSLQVFLVLVLSWLGIFFLLWWPLLQLPCRSYDGCCHMYMGRLCSLCACRNPFSYSVEWRIIALLCFVVFFKRSVSWKLVGQVGVRTHHELWNGDGLGWCPCDIIWAQAISYEHLWKGNGLATIQRPKICWRRCRSEGESDFWQTLPMASRPKGRDNTGANFDCRSWKRKWTERVGKSWKEQRCWHHSLARTRRVWCTPMTWIMSHCHCWSPWMAGPLEQSRPWWAPPTSSMRIERNRKNKSSTEQLPLQYLPITVGEWVNGWMVNEFHSPHQLCGFSSFLLAIRRLLRWADPFKVHLPFFSQLG